MIKSKLEEKIVNGSLQVDLEVITSPYAKQFLSDCYFCYL